MATPQIAGVPVTAGSKSFGYLSIAPMLHAGDLRVGVHVVAGAEPGPTIAILSTQHGDELLPLIGLKQLVEELDPQQLKGTVVVVPIANPIAFAGGSRDSWIDGLQADSGNLNRLWPGDPNGWITARLAEQLTKEIVEPADLVVDLHAAGRNSIYYCYMHDGDDELSQRQQPLALAFGMEILITRSIPYQGTLTGSCTNRGQLSFGVEVGDFFGLEADRQEGGSDRLCRKPGESCFTGLMNLLKQFGMLPGDIWRPRRQVAVAPETPIRTNSGGLLFPEVTRQDIGTVVPRGTILGRICDPYSFEELEVVRADCFDEQIIIAVNDVRPCAVQPGDKVYWVADWSTAQWFENGG